MRTKLTCGLGLALWAIVGAIAQAQSIPTLLLVHEDFYNHVGKPSIDKLIADLQSDGPFPRNPPVMKSIACRTTADLWVKFTDAEVLAEANRLNALQDLTALQVQDVKDLVAPPQAPPNPQSNKGKTKAGGNTRWAVDVHNATLINVVKSLGLRKAKILSGNSRLADAENALLPVVYVLMPTQSVLLPDPNKPGPSKQTHGRTFRDVRKAVSTSNYIGLAYSALLPVPGTTMQSVSTTLGHETGHYLALWHSFVSDDDLQYTDPDPKIQAEVRKAAQAIKASTDCAASVQFKNNQARDVDYYKSRRNVGDTVPIWRMEMIPSKYCVAKYQTLAPGFQAPSLNLMNYADKTPPPKHFIYARDNAKAALTDDQMALVRNELVDLLTKGKPENLCEP